jgi:hypothetical protein
MTFSANHKFAFDGSEDLRVSHLNESLEPPVSGGSDKWHP